MKPQLYHRWFCPYSEKVRNFITQHNLDEQIDYRDVEDDSESAGRLVYLTGGEQVPCLEIDGRPILESDDIISWMKEHLLGRGEAAIT